MSHSAEAQRLVERIDETLRIGVGPHVLNMETMRHALPLLRDCRDWIGRQVTSAPTPIFDDLGPDE